MLATKKCCSTRGTGGEAIPAIYDRLEELCSGGERFLKARSSKSSLERSSNLISLAVLDEAIYWG